MKADTILSQLETVASAMGVRVSYEPIQAAMGVGGICKVRGELRVIIDKRATTSERINTLARCLSRFSVNDVTPRLPEGVELGPQVRELLGAYAPTVRNAS